jgi:hypothetical protein
MMVNLIVHLLPARLTCAFIPRLRHKILKLVDSRQMSFLTFMEANYLGMIWIFVRFQTPDFNVLQQAPNATSSQTPIPSLNRSQSSFALRTSVISYPNRGNRQCSFPSPLACCSSRPGSACPQHRRAYATLQMSLLLI